MQKSPPAHLCRHTALTSGEDGTLRTWDTWTLAQRTVFKPTLRSAARVAATACCYSPSGHIIAAGLANGDIQLWDSKGAPAAHMRQTNTSYDALCWDQGLWGCTVASGWEFVVMGSAQALVQGLSLYVCLVGLHDCGSLL